jgi:hypothetical protein
MSVSQPSAGLMEFDVTVYYEVKLTHVVTEIRAAAVTRQAKSAHAAIADAMQEVSHDLGVLATHAECTARRDVPKAAEEAKVENPWISLETENSDNWDKEEIP